MGCNMKTKFLAPRGVFRLLLPYMEKKQPYYGKNKWNTPLGAKISALIIHQVGH